MKPTACLVVLVVLQLFPSLRASAQANGKLQIHFMNVGQGDGALLISPLGETALFDSGNAGDCDRPLSYLDQLGLNSIDYHIASHYHDDHIGCAPAVLERFQLKKAAFDRGEFHPTKTFTNYMNKVGGLRRAAIEGDTLKLDEASANPVRIEFVAMNGNGVQGANDENDKSLVCVVRFGQFDAVIGGDLSGKKKSPFKDIETSVAPKVGQVEVYKVNHHGSSFSSNTNWMATIKPKIGIISCGDGNSHNHPKQDCLDRLHDAGVTSYWTEKGAGALPVEGKDKIGGNIVVEYAQNSPTFTVTFAGNKVDTHPVWNPIGTQTSFSWSKFSSNFHLASCKFVKNISPSNLVTSTTAPEGRKLHPGCPK